MSDSQKKSGMKKAKILHLNPESSLPHSNAEETSSSVGYSEEPDPVGGRVDVDSAPENQSESLDKELASTLGAGAPEETDDSEISLSGKISIDPALETVSSRFDTRMRLTDDERFGLATKPSDELDGLLNTDISQRRGNYVFTVGRPQSGKSTLQSHLTRYLYQSGDYIPTPLKGNDDHAEQQAVSNEVLREWQRRWLVNRFPERTVSKHPSEYRFHMSPEKRRNRPLEFGYFEVAGEVYKQLLASGVRKPELPESLFQFLSNPKCRFLFLFVCIGHEIVEDDLIFSAFLDYLHEKFDDRFMQQSHIGIVISDPTSAIELLKKRRAESGRSGKLDKHEFVREFLPTTTARLKGWGNDFALAQFHVGDVKLDEDTNEPFIERPSFIDAKLVFDWIYECFLGVRPEPGPTMWERAQKWLAQFAD